jgi:uncharacterized membrane protein YcaP (DUF421 family)
MGKRQISQLTIFDYINGITIGSIAAELATLNNENYIRPLIALVVYCFLTLLISVLSEKSIKARKLFSGQPMVLFDNGEFYYGNLKRSKIDINEFLTLLRYEGYFDLADVQTAVLETNGMISILPVSTARPVTPEDLDIKPSQDKLVANVVLDGKIMPNILKQTGNDEQWLRRQLGAQGVKLGDCVLGTTDGDNVFTAYEKAPAGSEKKHPFI